MKVLYVISPDYLEAIVKETSDYSFAIQGYADIAKAVDSLHKTNINDILGFIYMADEMPEYYNDLINFIDKCSLMCDYTKSILFVVKDKSDLKDFLDYVESPAIKIEVITGYEVITDVIIKNSVLTILRGQEKPYLNLESEKFIDYRENDKEPVLSYEPLFSQRILDVTSDVFKLDTLDETKMYDVILRTYEGFDEIIFTLREAFIKAFFGIFTDTRSIVNSAKGDNNLYCTLECIARTINKTYLDNSQEVY